MKEDDEGKAAILVILIKVKEIFPNLSVACGVCLCVCLCWGILSGVGSTNNNQANIKSHPCGPGGW